MAQAEDEVGCVEHQEWARGARGKREENAGASEEDPGGGEEEARADLVDEVPERDGHDERDDPEGPHCGGSSGFVEPQVGNHGLGVEDERGTDGGGEHHGRGDDPVCVSTECLLECEVGARVWRGWCVESCIADGWGVEFDIDLVFLVLVRVRGGIAVEVLVDVFGGVDVSEGDKGEDEAPDAYPEYGVGGAPVGGGDECEYGGWEERDGEGHSEMADSFGKSELAFVPHGEGVG